MSESVTRKILLLDDDKFLSDMYGMKFAQHGNDVHACLSVEDAIATIKGGFVPDVILFDLVMPGEDGYTFLRKLEEMKLAPNAIKIALTNQSNDIERKKTEGFGVSRYIVKASLLPAEVVTAVEDEVLHSART